MNMDYHVGEATVALKKLSLSFSQCHLTHLDSIYPIDIAAAEFNLDAQGQMHLRGDGTWGQSRISASGKSSSDLEKLQVLIAGRVSLAEINEQFFPRIALPVTAPSMTGVRVMVERKSSTWQCQGQVFLKDHQFSLGSHTLLFDNPEDTATFEIDISDQEGISINRAQLHVGQSTLSAHGRYTKGNNYRLNMELTTDHLQLQDLNLHAHAQDSPFKGIVAGRLSFSTAMTPPFTPEFSGEIKAKALSLHAPYLPAPITDGTVHIVISKEKIDLNTARLVVGNDPLFITGQIKGWKKWGGRLQIKADRVDITQWRFDRSQAITESPPRPTRPIQIPIQIDIAKVRYRSLLYGPLTAQCTYRQDGTSIDRSQIQLNPGLLKVSGQIQRHFGADTLLSIYINTSEQPVEHLLEMVERKQKDIQLQGNLSLRGIGYLKSDGQRPLFRTLSGLFSFNLNDGAVKNDLALLRILDLLSLQNIFIRRPPDLRKESFFFETLQGTIEAKGGLLKIDNMIMRSPVFNSAITGSIDLKEGTVDLNLGAQPLGTIDYLVSKIPIAGHILTGKNKALLVYYFNIGGTFQKPTVKYTPFKKLDESILGYFQRTFFTPERIYKKIKNLADDLLRYDHPPTAEEIERFQKLQNPDIHK